MDELEYIRDSVRSTRAAIKSTQKQLRALLRFATDLDERLDLILEAHSLKEAQRDEGSRERVGA